MADTTSPTPLSIRRLILVPTLITLAVTLLRFMGELRRWGSPLFEYESGIVGITWLPPIFGFYFALKLWRASERTERVGRAFGLALLGVILNQGVMATVFPFLEISIFTKLGILWTVAIVSAILQYLAWPALFKTLAIYGLGARIPVAIIMFPTMRGHWGTHYDSGPPELGFWPRYLLFGLLEELIFWVSFTVATGSLAGSVAAAVAKRRSRESQAAA